MPSSAKSWYLFLASCFCLAVAMSSQSSYDSRRAKKSSIYAPLPPVVLKTFDLGLHSALASFLWLDTATELPFLPNGFDVFKNKFSTVTYLDPKFSLPYAFTTLILPNSLNYPKDKLLAAALSIGEEGLKKSDLDWRIPFHLGLISHADSHNYQKATEYFYLTSRTPGVPEYAQKFGINYSVLPAIRSEAKKYWQNVYDHSSTEEAHRVASDYLIRFNIFDLLEKKAKEYQKKTGHYPANVDDLITSGLLLKEPIDPFGFAFFFNEEGRISFVPLPKK